MIRSRESTLQLVPHPVFADRLDAIQSDYEAWEEQRAVCSRLDFDQDPVAAPRWAANEETAIDLLRRLADYHGWVGQP
jgi:hypothetical protein